MYQLAYIQYFLSVTQNKLVMYTYNKRLGHYYVPFCISLSSSNTHIHTDTETKTAHTKIERGTHKHTQRPHQTLPGP